MSTQTIENTETIIRVDPSKVKTRENFNPRVKPYTEDLKASILEHGIRESVEAFDQLDGTYLLNAQGHRRLLAITELLNENHTKTAQGEPLTFPVRLVSEKPVESLRLDILTLNTGLPLETIEKARVLAQIFTDAGVDMADSKAVREKAKELAPLVDMSVNGILNFITLATGSTKATQKMIESGKVSASQAIELFLEGKTKGNWDKVEDVLVEAVADAAAKGKDKVTKKDVKKEDKKETAAEKKAREQAEAEEAAEKEKDKLEAQARNKTVKNVARFFDLAIPLEKEEATGFVKVVNDLVVMTAAYLYPQGRVDEKGEKKLVDGDVSFGDVNSNIKAIIRAHNAALKEAVEKAEKEGKDKVLAVAAEFKAYKDSIKEAAKAASK